jgi:hypothetical protein
LYIFWSQVNRVSNLALAELYLLLFLGLLLKVDTIGHNQVSTVPGAVQRRLLRVQVDTIGHNQVITVPGAVQRRLLLNQGGHHRPQPDYYCTWCCSEKAAAQSRWTPSATTRSVLYLLVLFQEGCCSRFSQRPLLRVRT